GGAGGLCPSWATSCKLRMSGPNGRFQNMRSGGVAAGTSSFSWYTTPGELTPSWGTATPYRGCAVPDDDVNRVNLFTSDATPLVASGQTWCNPPSGTGYQPDYYCCGKTSCSAASDNCDAGTPPLLMAGFYQPAASTSAVGRGSWPAVWGDVDIANGNT